MSEYAGPRQLRHLLGAIMSVGSGLDLATVLERITGAAQELVGARYAALGVLDSTRTYLTEFMRMSRVPWNFGGGPVMVRRRPPCCSRWV